MSEKDSPVFIEIENLRLKMMQEDRALNIIDYGAGSPEESRSKEQMQEGFRVLKSTKEMCKIGLKNEWARFVYDFVDRRKPELILELGTCCGFSSIYMSKANPNATIYTVEGSPELAQIAKINFQRAGCKNIEVVVGRFDLVLPSLLKELKVIDFAFIDGHHDRDATVEYKDMIKPYIADKGVMLFDDISWSEGMREAWEIIEKDSDFKRCKNLEKFGVCYK